MAYALMARILERSPIIMDLIRRLENDPLFLLDRLFTISDQIPSEPYFSRFIRKIKAWRQRIKTYLFILISTKENMKLALTVTMLFPSLLHFIKFVK
jgi:hypothetical protein